MRDRFPGFYTPTADELDHIWTNGAVILDTNALLNLFRYSPATRAEFLAVLESIKDSVWLPYQVGLEFHRNRLDVINQQVRAFDEIEGSIASAKSDIGKALKRFERHPSLNAAGMAASLEQHLGEISVSLAEAREQHESAVLAGGENDRTFGAITELYKGKIGEPFAAERLKEIYEEGKRRYDRRIPPGFKDSDKPEPDRYGDLILWNEILEYGRRTGRPAVFVTDDAKEDWWYIVSGKTQGPRVELIDEYLAAANQRIHFYSPERFLKFAQERRGYQVSASSLTEVEEVSSARTSSRAVAVLQNRRDLLEEQRVHTYRQLLREQEQLDAEDSNAPVIDLEALRLEADHLQAILQDIESEIENLEAFIDASADDDSSSNLRNRRSDLERDRSEVRRRLRSLMDALRAQSRPPRDASSARVRTLMRRYERLTDELGEIGSALQDLTD